MNHEPRYIMGIISTPGEAAERIATALVEQKLAACAQITGPMTSIYYWNNAINRETEVLIYLKTRSDKTESINRLLESIHPYEVPEFIVFELTNGNRKYFEWIDSTITR